jgi:hypothetical protein
MVRPIPPWQDNAHATVRQCQVNRPAISAVPISFVIFGVAVRKCVSPAWVDTKDERSWL